MIWYTSKFPRPFSLCSIINISYLFRTAAFYIHISLIPECHFCLHACLKIHNKLNKIYDMLSNIFQSSLAAACTCILKTTILSSEFLSFSLCGYVYMHVLTLYDFLSPSLSYSSYSLLPMEECIWTQGDIDLDISVWYLPQVAGNAFWYIPNLDISSIGCWKGFLPCVKPSMMPSSSRLLNIMYAVFFFVHLHVCHVQSEHSPNIHVILGINLLWKISF